ARENVANGLDFRAVSRAFCADSAASTQSVWSIGSIPWVRLSGSVRMHDSCGAGASHRSWGFGGSSMDARGDRRTGLWTGWRSGLLVLGLLGSSVSAQDLPKAPAV